MLRRLWLLALTSAAALALSVAASANVDVFTDVDKDKDVSIDVDVNIDKDVFIDVDVDANPDGAAQSDVTKNQENFNNDADLEEVEATATIDGSAVGANGVLQVNQAPGVQNNQGNETSVAASLDFGFGIFTDAQVHAEQDNDFNTVTTDGVTNGGNGNGTGETVTLTDELLASFDTSAGIVGVNQSAGSQNNQNNANSIAIGDEALVAFAEADLGQDNFDNTATVNNAFLTDTIFASFNGFSGIANVNQSAGFQNNQANLTAISVNTGIVANGGAGGGVLGGL